MSRVPTYSLSLRRCQLLGTSAMPDPKPPSVSPSLSLAFDGTRATPTRPLLTKVEPSKFTDCAVAVDVARAKVKALRTAKMFREHGLKVCMKFMVHFLGSE